MRQRPTIPAAAAAAVIALLAVPVLLGGCAAADRPTSDTQARSIDVGGVQREYLVHIPGELRAEPTLVVFAHGGFGSAEQAESAYGWDGVADREGLVLAYPQASGAAWNAGGCCGAPARDGVDDVAFVSAMVGELQAEFGVDPSRTLATGMSNGAMLVYRMACETDVFAAIAPVAGTIVTSCDGAAPASVLHIHGLDDERVRFDGERGSRPTRVDGLPVDEVVAFWRAVDACEEPTTVEEGPLTSVRADCADGHVVELITVDGAGHQWPGTSGPGAAGRGAADPDPSSTAMDATDAIWRFFAAA